MLNVLIFLVLWAQDVDYMYQQVYEICTALDPIPRQIQVAQLHTASQTCHGCNLSHNYRKHWAPKKEVKIKNQSIPFEACKTTPFMVFSVTYTICKGLN